MEPALQKNRERTAEGRVLFVLRGGNKDKNTNNAKSSRFLSRGLSMASLAWGLILGPPTLRRQIGPNQWEDVYAGEESRRRPFWISPGV